ncbi:uncharacterized protein Bfra_012345 [Botrytis fragariae]|uniref:G domain-containing protein n=1 Tax=Botrytis fragariae TaxID=1964551 RepID=A0A8H6AJH7_9HELO|nr:uncharacterized protein Bfra_012345 [Botrytis fragariae]KAF5868435.1 hypothetical protein Bfra_012345 [Botrytis fragariae]
MGQFCTTMSSVIWDRKSEVDTDLATKLRGRSIKSENTDDSVSTMSEGIEPDMDSTVTKMDTAMVTRKEKAMEYAVIFLNKASNIVASHAAMFPEFKNWEDQIKQNLAGIERPRVLVGLLGYTGSGKSSLINALIDEEMVVPANAMRASTSVVTEISWNDSDDPDRAFRAEIEFISEEEWKKEMDVLLDDLANATKGEDVTIKSGSAASIAFAKISAVWPEVTLGKLKGMSSEQLFDEVDGVSDILDCSLEIADHKAKDFAEKISLYIDSNNKEVASAGISYWPLVRCVRVYTKAQILRHGLVLVDLPGLGDSNTGRTQVAENYMKNLDYIWIVADIVRAIDDQVAKDLMGKSFRRQLFMDGKYDGHCVTFIMSKTDIINNNEVISSLQLRKRELKTILAQEEVLMQNVHKVQETLIRKTAKNNKIKRELKGLQREVKQTKSEKATSRKRKFVEDSGAEEEVPSIKSQIPGKVSRQDLMRKKGSTIKEIEALDKRLAGLKLELRSARNEIKVVCTQARNTYTQNHLKIDFLNGLRELKQDISADRNDEFQSEIEKKVESESSATKPGWDNSKLIENACTEGLIDQLNTFCVSSKGYQRLAGRFKRNPKPKGFATINDTFIPFLREYAVACTLTQRSKLADRFLNGFNLVKLSISSWVENDSPNSLSSSEKDRLNGTLEEHLGALQKKFELALNIAMMRMKNAIKTDIFPMLQKCINASTQKAEEACKELVNEDICFQTWKAICRRRGKFSNRKNFNYDWVGVFSEPFLGHLAKPWENVFSSQMQNIHDEYARRIATAINRFSIDIKPLLRSMSEASASRSPLDFLAKVPYLQRKARTAITESFDSARSQAQEIHRAVEPLIQDHLRPVYEKCSRESKKGALARMKENLFEFIQETNETMYSESSTVLKTKLAKMTNNLEELLKEAHSDTSHYLREEIRNMIMWAVAKDDETRENVRKTLRKGLTVQLDALRVAWARGASEPADRFLPVKTETKPDDDSSEDNDEDDDISDDSDSSDNIGVGDNSDDSEEAEGTSDDMEDS